jgi:hypothetical protein
MGRTLGWRLGRWLEQALVAIVGKNENHRSLAGTSKNVPLMRDRVQVRIES